MNIHLSPKEKSAVVIVDIKGRLVLGEGTAAFRAKMQDLANRGHQRILLNMAEVARIDSSAIAELVAAYTRISESGGEIKMFNLPARLRDLITITKLHMVFEIYEDEESAIKSFGPPEPTELQRKYNSLFGQFTKRNLVPPATSGFSTKP